MKRVLFFGLAFFLLFLLILPYLFAQYSVHTKEPVLFLTFDDGPSETTPTVLEILAANNISATFFIVGQQAQLHPEILHNIAAQGHVIGLHSMTHPYLIGHYDRELVQAKQLVKSISGQEITLFRPAYGFMLFPTAIVAAREDLRVVIWSNFPRDYKATSEQIVRRVTRNLKPGAIIVLHDAPGNRSEMLTALLQILEFAKDEGYRFAVLE